MYLPSYVTIETVGADEEAPSMLTHADYSPSCVCVHWSSPALNQRQTSRSLLIEASCVTLRLTGLPGLFTENKAAKRIMQKLTEKCLVLKLRVI